MALTSNLTSFVPGRSAYTFALTSLLAVRVIYLRGVRRKHALPEGWVRATKAEKREARAALRQAKRAEKRQRTKERKRLRAKKMAKKSIAVQDILKEKMGADEFRRRRREEKALQKVNTHTGSYLCTTTAALVAPLNTMLVLAVGGCAAPSLALYISPRPACKTV